METPVRLATRYRRGRMAMLVCAGYATLVVATAVFVAIVSSLQPGSLAGIWLLLVTAPVSLLVQLLPMDAGAALFLVALTAGGLLQAWLLWLALRGPRVR